MIRRAATVTLLLLAFAATGVAAQQSVEQQEVLTILDRFFEGMTKRDTAMSRAAILPGAKFYITFEGKSEIASDTGYITSLTKGNDRWVEKIRNPTVLVHGDLAQVWTSYEFVINDKRSHCGVDSFTFLRTVTGWRMATAAYTIERTGCPD
jgi:hypothetical protein